MKSVKIVTLIGDIRAVLDYIEYVESMGEVKDIEITENEMDNKVLNIHFQESGSDWS